MKQLHNSHTEYLELLNNSKPQITNVIRGRKLELYIKSLEAKGLTQLQKDVIVGVLLGDGTLQCKSQSKPHLKFEQSARNTEERSYIDFLYSVFSSFVGTPPKPRFKNGKVHSYWFRTLGIPAFLFYSHQFYFIDPMGKRRKKIPSNIHQMLSPIVLAIWFMDDGSLTQTGYMLHTEGFTFPDIKVLQKALGRVFGLHATINRDNRETGSLYKLYIPARDRKKFVELVEPYILPVIRYKLGDF